MKQLDYEYTHREIADIMGISINEVKRLEYEALLKICAILLSMGIS